MLKAMLCAALFVSFLPVEARGVNKKATRKTSKLERIVSKYSRTNRFQVSARARTRVVVDRAE